MSSSIYVYDKKTYDVYYKDYRDEYKVPIVDIYYKPKTDSLWMVTKIMDERSVPMLNHSIVHFINGDVDEYKDGDEVLIEHEKVYFNPKNKMLEFHPKLFRKPIARQHVDRVLTDKEIKKKIKIDYEYRFYDIVNNRINFVVKTS